MSEHPRLKALPGGLEESARPVRRGTPPAPALAPAQTSGPEPLWREALGERLRSMRLDLGEKLTETAGRAGISPQYLSEVERGRKEPSSEMIAALAGALGTSVGGLTHQVAEDMLRTRRVAAAPSVVPQRYAGRVMLSLAA
ncbi:helix-turn-helix domain-containing protein [Nocardia tengchongensis]|uniref:helix-turn-helix domain-containing protein n=1 Tax=Nocardia tengchongensis TaxID=2055889 RepID=UPI0036CEF84B